MAELQVKTVGELRELLKDCPDESLLHAAFSRCRSGGCGVQRMAVTSVVIPSTKTYAVLRLAKLGP